MGLAALADSFTAYLESALSPAPALVGASYPAAAADLPAVVVSFNGVTRRLRGVGALPAQSQTGALSVNATVDLANPVVAFPDASVTLLSGDRMTLTLPHGPLVAADGTTTSFTSSDVQVTLGATTFAVVTQTPLAGQVMPDAAAGVLHFGAALPATGTLNVGYFIGEWSVRSERYEGTLTIETFATDAAGVETLSRGVDSSLLDPTGPPLQGLERIEPTSWLPTAAADATRAGARGRAQAYAFDFELIKPDIGAGGGVIVTVSVIMTVSVTQPGSPNPVVGTEQFQVQREGSIA